MEYHMIQRKSDGLYASVDGGFTADRAGKAFVFSDGNDSWKYTDRNQYEIVPLTDDEILRFEIASESICAECHEPFEQGEPTEAPKAGARYHLHCWDPEYA